jgi:hypothetical protein
MSCSPQESCESCRTLRGTDKYCISLAKTLFGRVREIEGQSTLALSSASSREGLVAAMDSFGAMIRDRQRRLDASN